MRVYRKDIIGQIKYRKGFIFLLYSNHAKERLQERVNGELIVAPTQIQVTDNNIYSGETNDNKKLTQACIRLNYKTDKWMFLVVVLRSGVVKSLWINDKKRKIREEVGNVQENLEKKTPQVRSKWYSTWEYYKELFFRSCFGKKQVSRIRI